MRDISPKPRPRRAMRVATIFTGVAACTVGTTQVANAHTRPAVPAGHTGSIRLAHDCAVNGIDHEWLHVSNPSSPAPTVPFVASNCFGFKGAYYSPPGVGINAECGGNNFGYLLGYKTDGDSWSFHYGPGTRYHTLKESHLDTVTIYSWSGTDTCGIAPYFGSLR
jgi:hypothetical protein